MESSGVWFILLVIWVFILQNRISDLEKTVLKLKEREQDIPSKEAYQKVAEQSPITEALPSQEYISESVDVTSSIEHFSPEHPISSAKEPSKLITWINNYFTGGNLLVRIGGVVLFFGLAFLVKYAAEHSLISIEMRLSSVAVAAIVLIGIGWRLRYREGAYGQILQGLGIAMLYLVIYASSKFYMLLSLEMAFGLMFVVVVFGSALSVREDSFPLALFAAAGGFMVPILTSSGQGSHVVLFSYYAFLNLGIFMVAWYRSWRILNVVGFVFTFVIATLWGVLRYSPDLFGATEPFLILYFVMYLMISILFTLKHPFKPLNFVDGTIVFGLPMVAFPLQINLVETIPYAEAYSAIALGTLYVVLYLWLRNKERTDLLAQTFLALGAVFYTIAIPYLFDDGLTAALWSLESSAVIWLSLRQHRLYARYFGEVLLVVSVALYPSVNIHGITLVEYIGYVIVIAATLSVSYLLDKYRLHISGYERPMPVILLIVSIVLWFVSTPTQLVKVDRFHEDVMMFSLVIGTFVFFVVAKVFAWKLLVHAMQGYLLLGILFFIDKHFYDIVTSTPFQPFFGYSGLALGLFIAGNYLLMYALDKIWVYTKGLHILSLWFVVSVLMLECRYHAIHFEMGEALILVFIAVVPIVFSFALLWIKRYPGWLEKHRESYQFTGVGGLIAVLIIWELKAFAVASDRYMFWGIPLINPLDLIQITVLCIAGFWIYSHKRYLSQQTQTIFYALVAFMGTILASVIFARAIHLYRDVIYRFDVLWHDLYFQAGLSILWSLIAIVVMLLSKRYTNRMLWMGGFGLLVVVVMKLFFIELANSGTIERIISFIVVGLLLLLIGYFVPLPPSSSDNEIKKKHIDNTSI